MQCDLKWRIRAKDLMMKSLPVYIVYWTVANLSFHTDLAELVSDSRFPSVSSKRWEENSQRKGESFLCFSLLFGLNNNEYFAACSYGKGKGAVFTATIPLRKIAPPRHHSVVSTFSTQQMNGNQRKLLLVDVRTKVSIRTKKTKRKLVG